MALTFSTFEEIPAQLRKFADDMEPAAYFYEWCSGLQRESDPAESTKNHELAADLKRTVDKLRADADALEGTGGQPDE